MKMKFFSKYGSVALLVMGMALQLSAQNNDFRKKAPASGPAPKIEMGAYTEFVLDNGLKVIVVENHKLPRVSFQLSIDVPPFKEGDVAGAADIAGQLLSKGTTTRTKAQIDEAVDFIGASLNTSAEGIFGASLTKHKDKLIALMADVLLNPAFSEEEFTKLKTQTLSGLAASKDDPATIAQNVAQVLNYGKDHPYGELTTEETVGKITLQDCKSYYDNYYRPNRGYLVVVGDISVADAKKIAQQHFGAWKKKEMTLATIPAVKGPAANQVSFVHKTGAVQSLIYVTYPVDLKQGSPDVVKAQVLNTVLGSGFSGRLFKNLRETKAYTYGAYSTLQQDRYVGYFNAEASVRNEVTDSAVVQFMYELELLTKEKVSQKELDLAKNQIAGSFSRSLENPQTVARFALNTSLYKLPKDYYATFLERLKAVTSEDILATAKKYIKPGNANIVVVGDKDASAEKLKAFSANGKVHFYDIYGTKINMDGAVVPTGMTAEAVIDSYLKAIGGKEALMGVKDMTMSMTTSAQGQTIGMTIQRKAPNKMAMTVDMSGMVLNQTKFDGVKGEVSQMGQAQPMDEAGLKELKDQSAMFAELEYAKNGAKLELKGVEPVEGKDAYKIEITSASGKKSTDFFDKATGLKIRSIETQEGPQGPTSSTSDYEDYREVNGVKVPYRLKTVGLAPFPLIFEVKSVEVNKGIDDSVFQVK